KVPTRRLDNYGGLCCVRPSFCDIFPQSRQFPHANSEIARILSTCRLHRTRSIFRVPQRVSGKLGEPASHDARMIKLIINVSDVVLRDGSCSFR
ncbi:hypothetical protein PENTCL1PPCAC_20609, partial [Pristionchus entomophagus]